MALPTLEARIAALGAARDTAVLTWTHQCANGAMERAEIDARMSALAAAEDALRWLDRHGPVLKPYIAEVNAVRRNPIVADLLAHWPGAELVAVRPLQEVGT